MAERDCCWLAGNFNYLSSSLFLLMKKRCFLLLSVVTSYYAVAQQDAQKIKQKYLQFAVGLAHYRLIDEEFTYRKLPFKATLPKFQLAFIKETSRSIFNASIEGSTGNARSKQGSLHADINYGQVAFSYSRLVKDNEFAGLKSRLYAGAALSSVVHTLQNNHEVDNRSVILVHGLYLNVLQRIQVSTSNSVDFILLLPAITVSNNLSVPEMNVVTKTSFFNLLAPLRIKVHYVNTLSPRTQLNVKYQFYYIRNPSGKPMRLYSNEIMAGFTFNL